MLANRVDPGIDKSPTSERPEFYARTGQSARSRVSVAYEICLWPRRPEDREIVRALAQENIDWNVFLEMMELHRLTPIVFHNLGGVCEGCRAVGDSAAP